jgi:hypothetical protein
VHKFSTRFLVVLSKILMHCWQRLEKYNNSLRNRSMNRGFYHRKVKTTIILRRSSRESVTLSKLFPY